MFSIFKPSKKDEPVRLHKVEQEEDALEKIERMLVNMGFILLLILLVILFLLVCMFLVPKTYGFFVW